MGNITITSILKQSGYFELHNEINESDIAQVLNDNPDYIEIWLNWSADQRASSGWYFLQKQTGEYVVNYHSGPQDIENKTYSDKFEACASYIRRFIEEIRISYS